MRTTPLYSSHAHRCFSHPVPAAAKCPSSVFTCIFPSLLMHAVDDKHAKCSLLHRSLSPSFNCHVVCVNRLWKRQDLITRPPLSLNEKSCPRCVLCGVGATLHLSPPSEIPVQEELVEERSPGSHHSTQLSACLFIEPAFVLAHRVCLAMAPSAECGVLQ